jgi:hypothetical protein
MRCRVSRRFHAVRMNLAKPPAARPPSSFTASHSQGEKPQGRRRFPKVRGRAGRDAKIKRRSGIVHSTAAVDSASRPASAEGAKTSREAPGQTALLCVRQCDEAQRSEVRAAQVARSGRPGLVRRVPTAGKQRADWFGRPVRGDGEGVEAQAEVASMTPAVTNRVRSVPSAGSRSRRDGQSQ